MKAQSNAHGKFAFIEYGGAYKNGVTKIERLELAGEKGFRALLPISETEAGMNEEAAASMVDSAVSELRNFDVGIVLPPKNVRLSKTPGVSVASGALIFPFFIADCARFQYKKIMGSRDISKATAVIAAESRKMAELTINCLAGDVQALCVCESEDLGLEDVAGELMYSYGITLTLMKTGAEAYQDADIIINLKTNADRHENVYKENAVFADLSGNDRRLWDISRRRPDVTVFDGMRIKLRTLADEWRMSLPVLEMFLYNKSPAYRELAKNPKYDHRSAAQVAKLIERYSVKVLALQRLGKTL